MRNSILFAALAALLALGAVSANAQSNLTQPSASPYAILNQTPAANFLTEGRSAFIAQDAHQAAPARGSLKTSGPVSQPLESSGR
jgi:ABC-type sugar transport system substrate-binding protein